MWVDEDIHVSCLSAYVLEISSIALTWALTFNFIGRDLLNINFIPKENVNDVFQSWIVFFKFHAFFQVWRLFFKRQTFF